MNAEERLEYLLESVFVPTNATVTIGDIRDNLGLTQSQYGLVRSTLDGAITTLKKSSDTTQKFQGIELQDALSAMLAGGISLSNPDRQATIDMLATFGNWPNEVRDKVKAAGGTMRPRWQTLAIIEEPTLESVQSLLDDEQSTAERQRKQEIRTATIGTIQSTIAPLQSKLNAIATWLGTDEALAKSVEEYQAYADQLIASEDGNP